MFGFITYTWVLGRKISARRRTQSDRSSNVGRTRNFEKLIWLTFRGSLQISQSTFLGKFFIDFSRILGSNSKKKIRIAKIPGFGIWDLRKISFQSHLWIWGLSHGYPCSKLGKFLESSRNQINFEPLLECLFFAGRRGVVGPFYGFCTGLPGWKTPEE